MLAERTLLRSVNYYTDIYANRAYANSDCPHLYKPTPAGCVSGTGAMSLSPTKAMPDPALSSLIGSENLYWVVLLNEPPCLTFGVLCLSPRSPCELEVELLAKDASS